MKMIGFVLGLWAAWFALPAMAQDDPAPQGNTWLQIEAQPNLNTAMDRARAYAALFPDVEGYQLSNGWYGIALGPAAKDVAAARLLDLRRQNMIPSDSYLADGSNYEQRFWPVSVPVTQPAPPAPQTAEVTPQPAEPLVEPPPAEQTLPQETLAEAKASEAALSKEERALLQEALKWYGFYDGALDGAFGKGSRASFAAWQAANGFEETAILTTSQRRLLTETFAVDKAEFGFETVTEAGSGIEINLPLALVRFDRYEPPFVHYNAVGDSGIKLLLISEPGGEAALSALYDVLQTLEIMPPQGERALDKRSFTMSGRNDQIETRAFAEVAGGNVKGYMISWPVADADRMARILPVLASSFRSLGDQSLDPGLVPLSAAAKRGLLAGLDVRHPKLSRSGFFIDDQGTVLTTLQAVSGCGKVFIERSVEASVAFTDDALGIAVLTPKTPMAPKSVARFAAPPRSGDRAALSGYSYEDRLPAPVITNGLVEDVQGLNGEAGLTRLSVLALPGDAGGPVLATTGAVLGMLLPPDTTSARSLPEGVAFAASADVLMAALTAKGLTPAKASGTAAASPDAMASTARDMTVLVSCWE